MINIFDGESYAYSMNQYFYKSINKMWIIYLIKKIEIKTK